MPTSAAFKVGEIELCRDPRGLGPYSVQDHGRYPQSRKFCDFIIITKSTYGLSRYSKLSSKSLAYTSALCLKPGLLLYLLNNSGLSPCGPRELTIKVSARSPWLQN